MQNSQAQIKILAQAIYQIRLLLSSHLGSSNTENVGVSVAAHLAYALHNEALSILEGGSFDAVSALSKIRGVDHMFGEDLTPRFEAIITDDSKSDSNR